MAQQVLVETDELAISSLTALPSHSLLGGLLPKVPLSLHFLYVQASLPHQILLMLAPQEEGGVECRLEMRK